jgi:hypothetical protein
MTTRNCASCWHSRPIAAYDTGEVACHRRAPALVDNTNRVIWPVVAADDCCSEWEPEPAAEFGSGPDLREMLQAFDDTPDPLTNP